MDREELRRAAEDLNGFGEYLDGELVAGRLDEDQWYALAAAATAEAYLPRDNPRAQSGHSGDEARWRYGRVSMILEAIHRSGTFLDVGCANGYLVESLDRWVKGSGLDVEFSGVDISEGLIELARRRLPEWRGRFFVANAVRWTPPRKLDFVHAHETSYAPPTREKEFFEHLLADYLQPGGRLIVGPWAVDRDFPGMEDRIASWGYRPSGYLVKSQEGGSHMTRKMIWFDA